MGLGLFFFGVSVSSLLPDIQDQCALAPSAITISPKRKFCSQSESLCIPQLSSQAKMYENTDFISMWEQEYRTERFAGGTASHKEQKSCSEAKGMQNQLTQQLNPGKQQRELYLMMPLFSWNNLCLISQGNSNLLCQALVLFPFLYFYQWLNCPLIKRQCKREYFSFSRASWLILWSHM